MGRNGSRTSKASERPVAFKKQFSTSFDFKIYKQKIYNIMSAQRTLNQLPQVVKLVLNTTSKSVIRDKKLLIPPLSALGAYFRTKTKTYLF